MIVSCGEALVDVVAGDDGEPRAVPGGGPMNVAVTAARLGAPAAFVGAVSTDAHGDLIRGHLMANGVDVRALARTDRPTARAIVEHRPHLVFRFEGDDTADMQLGSVDVAALGPGPHIVHGGTLGLFRGATAETLARYVESGPGLVSLDPNVRPSLVDDRDRWHYYHDRWLARAHVYKASDEDLAWIWPGREPSSCAEELVAGGVGVVIVTRGASGLTILTADGQVGVPAPLVTVVDTVGAGDTIVGTVLASLWERAGRAGGAPTARLPLDEWREIGRHAVTAAAITCSRQGADPPYRSELGW